MMRKHFLCQTINVHSRQKFSLGSAAKFSFYMEGACYSSNSRNLIPTIACVGFAFDIFGIATGCPLSPLSYIHSAGIRCSPIFPAIV